MSPEFQQAGSSVPPKSLAKRKAHNHSLGGLFCTGFCSRSSLLCSCFTRGAAARGRNASGGDAGGRCLKVRKPWGCFPLDVNNIWFSWWFSNVYVYFHFFERLLLFFEINMVSWW